MRELLELIDEVLAERRWSARQASIEAVGTPNVIMNMRRGRVPSINRLRALCDVLGLEFYIGRSRTVPGAEFDVDRLALALDAVAVGFPDADRAPCLCRASSGATATRSVGLVRFIRAPASSSARPAYRRAERAPLRPPSFRRF